MRHIGEPKPVPVKWGSDGGQCDPKNCGALPGILTRDRDREQQRTKSHQRCGEPGRKIVVDRVSIGRPRLPQKMGEMS